MELDEVLKKEFFDDFMTLKKGFMENIEEILEYISSLEGKVRISCYKFSIMDVLEKMTDKNYLSYQKIKKIENGMKLIYFDDEMFASLKGSISKDIDTLEIPVKIFLNNIDYFKDFKNLKTLIVDDCSLLDERIFSMISQYTNISEIYSRDYPVLNQYNRDDFTLLSYPHTSVYYQDIVLKPIESDIKKSKDLKIRSSVIKKDTFENIFSSYYDEGIQSVFMEVGDREYNITFLEDRVIDEVDILTDDLEDISRFYNYLISNGYTINKIRADISSINYEDMNLGMLSSINTDLLSICYNHVNEASFSDFLGFVESMKWYRSLIDSDMSPVEKLTFAYDLVKSLKYKASLDDFLESRAPHNIMKTGSIVCAGYTALFKEILKNKDEHLKIGDASISCYDKNGKFRAGHSRVIASIDDVKYGIDGIFACDITWDSVGNFDVDKFPDDYTALSLYQYFLIPKSEYQNVFPKDSIPDIFKDYDLEDKYKLVSSYNNTFYGSFSRDYENDISYSDINKRLETAKRPSINTFRDIVYQVRLREGYSRKDALVDVETIDKVNPSLIEMLDDDFKEEEKRIRM